MPRKGLNRQVVINAAIQLIEEKGYHNFSMRELADRLQVKTASLYNHVSNMDSLHSEIGYYAISELRRVQLAAIRDKQRDDAVLALACAYYDFAKEHTELYKIIMSLSVLQDDDLLDAAGDVVESIMIVLSGYDLGETQKIHLQRVLRSIMHGFISQEEAGCFRHFPVEVSESFRVAISYFLDNLHKMEWDGKSKRLNTG